MTCVPNTNTAHHRNDTGGGGGGGGVGGCTDDANKQLAFISPLHETTQTVLLLVNKTEKARFSSARYLDVASVSGIGISRRMDETTLYIQLLSK